MDIYESGEDYLEYIYMLNNQGKTNVRSIDLARHFNYSRASISHAMKLLEQRGYVTFSDKNYLILTEKGLDKAKKMCDRHLTLTKVFIHLGVDEKTAESDACKIEHDISEEGYQALVKLLDK